MTHPPIRPSGKVPVQREDEAKVRRAGRNLVVAIYGALRAIRLYPAEHVSVQKALGDLAGQCREVAFAEGEIAIRISGEFIFLNATRLRLGVDNFASFSHFVTLLRAAGVGSVQVDDTVSAKDWLIFLTHLQTPVGDEPSDRYDRLTEKLDAAGVHAIAVGPPAEAHDASTEESKERAKRTYSESVAVTRELMSSVRMGQSPNIKRIKRVVQRIVDEILSEETSLIGLTAIRDYDEYTFTHSVNVCILAVALGKRLAMTKVQLYDLGLAALFHDIGKSRVPSTVLNKEAGLEEDEWRMITNHPWLGMFALFHLRGANELPYRAMIVAHEHHMKRDLSGYPKPIRPRRLSMFSRIVAVADAFDAATSRRSYQDVPFTPAQVMAEMRDNPKRGMDPVIVKAFINLTGIYPVGTLVVLDTVELGVVHAANPIPDLLSRPIVRIISDPHGNVVHPGILADLAERDGAGHYVRTIIKTEDPEQYGIRVGDYFI